MTTDEIPRLAEDAAAPPFITWAKQASCGSSSKGMRIMRDKGARWAVGVFGDSSETGPGRPGTRTRAVAVFGDSTLDMRGAIAGEEIAISAVAGFGDVRVLVPAGSRVEISGFALFGDKRSEVLSNPTSDGPVVRVKACALFGDVKIA